MFHHDLFARISLSYSFCVFNSSRWLLQLVMVRAPQPRLFFFLSLFFFLLEVILLWRSSRRSSEKKASAKSSEFFIIRKFMLWKVSLNVESCGSHYLGVCSVLLLCWALSGVRVAVVESIHDWLRCYNCLVLIVCLFVCIIGLTWLSSMLVRSSAAVYSIHWSARRQWFNSTTMRCVYIRFFSQ